VTIKKGSPYGHPGSLPPGAVTVGSDREARDVLEAARRQGEPFPVLGLTGGDLCRTLGGTGALEVVFPVDVGEVLIDGRIHVFVAHLVARTSTWSDVVVAMNAQWVGRWNLGPKAHPGDGLLDTYRAALSPAERLKVRARLHHGAHLPHPGIAESRTSALQVDDDRSRRVWLDGSPIGAARVLAMHVRPDALTVVV
jgi:hypothetical protein